MEMSRGAEDAAPGSAEAPPVGLTPRLVLEFWFSVLVVGTAVVFFWRGVWTGFNYYLCPGDERASAWYSLCISLGIFISYFVLLACQLVPDSASDRLWLAVLSRLYTLVLGVAAVTFWRGVWLLQDIELLPEHPEASLWVSIGAGTLVLLLCGSLRCVLAPPVGFVADEDPLAYFIGHFTARVAFLCCWKTGASGGRVEPPGEPLGWVGDNTEMPDDPIETMVAKSPEDGEPEDARTTSASIALNKLTTKMSACYDYEYRTEMGTGNQTNELNTINT